MDERSKQFRVGMMVVVTTLILAILLVLFGDLPSLVKGTYLIRLDFPQAPGVTPDTPVRVNGVLIGRVKSVTLDAQGRPEIIAKIEKQYELFHDQMARVSGSLLGDAVVEIVPGVGQAPHTPLQSGDTLRGTISKDPLEAIVGLEANISGAVESIARTSDEIRALANRANRILDQNELQFSRIVENTDQTVLQLRGTVANFNDLVGDEQLRANLKASVNNFPVVLADFSDAITRIKGTMQLADQNLANLEGLTKPLGERGPGMVENVDRALGQIDGLIRDVNQFTSSLSNSQGTFSRLMNDPQLYNDVSDAVRNLNELTRELKPIIRDARAFTDKAARHPEQFGVRGLIQQNSGIK